MHKFIFILGTAKVLDIGIGTGAIGLALLSNYKNLTCLGLDINPLAISLASENAKSLQLESRYNCILKSFKEYAEQFTCKDVKFDLIISNPPYIPTKEMSELEAEVARYEDHFALHGGEDGMDIIREIIDIGPSLLSSKGSKEIWMEVSSHHPKEICRLVKVDERWRQIYSHAEAIDDIFGKPRFVRLKVK